MLDDIPEAVRNKYHRLAFAARDQPGEYFALGDGIQRGRGLIDDDQTGIDVVQSHEHAGAVALLARG